MSSFQEMDCSGKFLFLSFWYSELCKVDQTVTVQRGSVLDVRGPEWFCQPFCSLWISAVLGDLGGLYQWFAQQSGLPSEVIFGSWAEPDSYWSAEDRFNDDKTVSAAPVAGWTSSVGEGSTTSAGSFHNGLNVIVPLQVLRNCGTQESEWLYCSHSVVHDGEWGRARGISPEVHDHLHSFEDVELQVVKTAPDSQLLNLLSVSRLVTVLNDADQCGVICKLQELDGGVFGCAVIRVEREEQWGENTAMRSWSCGC